MRVLPCSCSLTDALLSILQLEYRAKDFNVRGHPAPCGSARANAALAHRLLLRTTRRTMRARELITGAILLITCVGNTKSDQRQAEETEGTAAAVAERGLRMRL